MDTVEGATERTKRSEEAQKLLEGFRCVCVPYCTPYSSLGTWPEMVGEDRVDNQWDTVLLRTGSMERKKKRKKMDVEMGMTKG